jgi:hypothetical protein
LDCANSGEAIAVGWELPTYSNCPLSSPYQSTFEVGREMMVQKYRDRPAQPRNTEEAAPEP